jgi:hypothetical protein
MIKNQADAAVFADISSNRQYGNEMANNTAIGLRRLAKLYSRAEWLELKRPWLAASKIGFRRGVSRPGRGNNGAAKARPLRLSSAGL